MSYSRWSNSTWYTYWQTSYTSLKELQVFDVCAIKAFKYKELKDDLEGCLDQIKKLSTSAANIASDKEMEELKGYMLTFISDVENDEGTKYSEELRACVISPGFKKWLKSSAKYEDSKHDECIEAVKVIEAPFNELPLWINKVEYPLSKEIIITRLKEKL